VHQLVLRQRRFFAGHSFFVVWWGFTLTALIAMFAEWALLCLFRWQLFPFLPVLLQMLLAVVIFPLPCWLLIKLQRAALTAN